MNKRVKVLDDGKSKIHYNGDCSAYFVAGPFDEKFNLSELNDHPGMVIWTLSSADDGVYVHWRYEIDDNITNDDANQLKIQFEE